MEEGSMKSLKQCNIARLDPGILILTPLILVLSMGKVLALEIDEATNPAHAKQKIELQCGQHTIAITCGNLFDPVDARMGRKCNHNILTFTGPDGKVIEPPPPKSKNFDFYGKTPVGFGCDKAKNDHYYVEVDYSSCLGNANTCITTHLFTSTGDRLTADISDRMEQLHKARTKLELIHITLPFIYIEGEQ
jgi:hypothetical protein